MLANLFFYSCVLGLLCLLFFSEKYQKISVFVFIASIIFICCNFLDGYEKQVEDSFSFFWMQTKKYHIEINIDTSLKNYMRLLPVFAISLILTIGGELSLPQENKKNFYSCIAFSLANMILLISSKNLVQLMTCVCVADIITQVMIKNFGVSKKYMFYSLLADFGLFMIFAIIQGKMKSFDLDVVETYKKIGRHKDFVAIATLLFLFSKMGLFMFQGSLLDLKNIKTCKLISIISFSGSLASFFVLIKIYPLLQISGYSTPLLRFFVAGSATWGLLNGIIMGGINRQIVYFGMILYSFVIYIFMLKDFFAEQISYSLVLGTLTYFMLSAGEKYTKVVSRFVALLSWVALFYEGQFERNATFYAYAAAIIVFLCGCGNIPWFYKFTWLQKADIFSKFYDYVFIKPVLIFSRSLWLLVDFMIMERHVVGSVEAAGDISSGYIEKIKDCSITMKILWLLFFVTLFAVSFYLGGNR